MLERLSTRLLYHLQRSLQKNVDGFSLALCRRIHVGRSGFRISYCVPQLMHFIASHPTHNYIPNIGPKDPRSGAASHGGSHNTTRPSHKPLRPSLRTYRAFLAKFLPLVPRYFVSGEPNRFRMLRREQPTLKLSGKNNLFYRSRSRLVLLRKHSAFRASSTFKFYIATLHAKSTPSAIPFRTKKLDRNAAEHSAQPTST